MKQSQKYLILGGALLLLLVLIYFIGTNKGKASRSRKDLNYKTDSVIIKKPINPSGTFLLYQLLRDYKNTSSIQKIQTTQSISLSKVLPKEPVNKQPNIYISISENYYLNDKDSDWLLEFVKEGNNAFIACENLSSSIRNALSDSSFFWFNSYYDTTFLLNFYHQKFVKKRAIEIKNSDLNSHRFPKYKNWKYFYSPDLDNRFVKIAYNQSEKYPICLLLKYGKGTFIIHATPPAFSNYNLLSNESKYHAEVIFSHLPQGNIYWHNDFGKYSPYRGSPQPTSSGKDNSDKASYPKSSPLQYIMKVPALFTALILLIVGAFLYMLFQSKRRQKIIPAIESNENSSVEFVETVSKLYFQQKRHDKLIKHQETLFLSFLRQQYYISSPKTTTEFIKKITLKSGIEEEKVKAIFTGFKRGITNKNVTEKELINLYNKLEYFYKNCY